MRGALRARPMTRIPPGIIPADAGSTSGPAYDPNSARDHPRGCGEHLLVCGVAGFEQGSSPRMRGARHCGTAAGRPVGIIPADAGSTCRRQDPRATTGDHPRGCGEHFCLVFPQASRLGSSPRMRGAHPPRSLSACPCRIIPADAGSTGILLCRGTGGGDHPRGCGEHDGLLRRGDTGPGSSPRMRGAQEILVVVGCIARIIPADAGSTWFRPSPGHDRWDHPRGCGEH